MQSQCILCIQLAMCPWRRMRWESAPAQIETQPSRLCDSSPPCQTLYVLRFQIQCPNRNSSPPMSKGSFGGIPVSAVKCAVAMQSESQHSSSPDVIHSHAPGSSVELAPLNINPILLHGHPQVLHRQHRLRPARPSSAKPSPLHTQSCTLTSLPTTSTSSCAPASTTRTTRRRSTSHGGGRKTIGRAACADTAILVGVSGDVGDEFLGREAEEAREGKRSCVGGRAGWVGGRRWRKAGEGEVVRCHCVGYLCRRIH
jgi:hypothetical protein